MPVFLGEMVNVYTAGTRQCRLAWWRQYPGLLVRWSQSRSRGVSLMHVRRAGVEVVLKQNSSGKALTNLRKPTPEQNVLLQLLIEAGIITTSGNESE